MNSLKGKLIVLRSHKEIAGERTPALVSEAESTFFSESSKERVLFELSDGYFCFSEEDIESINRRLNHQPNLFGIYFDVSVVPSNSDIGGYEHYIQVKKRRAA